MIPGLHEQAFGIQNKQRLSFGNGARDAPPRFVQQRAPASQRAELLRRIFAGQRACQGEQSGAIAARKDHTPAAGFALNHDAKMLRNRPIIPAQLKEPR